MIFLVIAALYASVGQAGNLFPGQGTPIYCSDKKMEIVYDPVKRAATLETRGLDMAKAGEVFDGPTLTVEDDRRDYGEPASLQLAS